jgi:hypothetical protein
LLPGEVVWVVVKKAGNPLWYPSSVPCVVTEDRWTCPTVEFGTPPTTGLFEASVVIANGDGQAALLNYWRSTAVQGHPSGLRDLPRGVSEWDLVRVIRS